MATWSFKTVKGHRYLFVYTRNDGRQVQVKPRSEYSHLDAAPDYEIEAWVKQWSEQYENKKVRKDNILFSDDSLNRYLADYVVYLRDVKELAQGTREKYLSLVRRYAIPYFLEQGLKDPQQWAGVSVRLYDYLKKLECSPVLVAEVNNALRGFFSWMQEQGIVAYGGELRLRQSRRQSKPTPLAYTIMPEQILKFIRATSDVEIKIIALLGYFFSLRSQEIFAAVPERFRAGDDAKRLECSKAMAALELFDELVFEVKVQQRSRSKEHATPKSHSAGWVCCFSREAAELLKDILNARKDLSEQFLARDNRAIYRKWELATKGTELESIDIKSLRRASLYHLGHHTQITLVNLQKHARHRQSSTTEIYLRRPTEHLNQKPVVGGFAFSSAVPVKAS